MVTIEELMEVMSGVNCPDNLTLTIELFRCWKEIRKSIEPNSEEKISEFLKWSPTLLHDFNEVDRAMADPDDFFSNLNDIKHLENWSLNHEPLTEFQVRYLEFMNQLGKLHELFKKNLLKQNLAWSGLAARIAANSVAEFEKRCTYDKLAFLGFNALNACERKIFYHYERSKRGIFMWDIDAYYFNDPQQEAGLFLRKFFQNSKNKPESWLTNDLLTGEKEIEIISSAGNIGQAATGVNILEKWVSQGERLENTAIILADETLLFPVLTTLPEKIGEVNISLEFPINLTSIYDLCELILNWQLSAWKKNTSAVSIYYKDFFRLFYNQAFRLLLGENEKKNMQEACDVIREFNMSFLSPKWLEKKWPDTFIPVRFLFEKWISGEDAVMKLEQLNEKLLTFVGLKQDKDATVALELEYIQAMATALNRLKELIKSCPEINDIPSIFQLLKEIMSAESVAFDGEALHGLQLMGVLETRTLDFEKIIILGVNEGVLPSGKSGATFIPFDLKKHFGLPLHLDKDAVYAYHFYRLLQRAKKICILYNSETDAFGSGEKSRFITQLEMELPLKNKNATVTERISTGNISTSSSKSIFIDKNENAIQILIKKLKGKIGLSASAINLYKECSLKFWFKYVGNLAEDEELDEEMKAGTFGDILHKVLENLYAKFVSKKVSSKELHFSDEEINEEINKAYQFHYPEETELKGKNYLATKIIFQYIKKMTRHDATFVRQLEAQQKELILVAVEKDIFTSLSIDFQEEPFEINFSGKIDRIDLPNDLFRIVDYKSSVNSDRDDFKFKDFETLFQDPKQNKLFQLFFYSWLCFKENLSASDKISPCIIPFKNYKGHPEYILDKDDFVLKLTDELLKKFEDHLLEFVRELLNPINGFKQTDIIKKCQFCSYNLICNRKEKET